MSRTLAIVGLALCAAITLSACAGDRWWDRDHHHDHHDGDHPNGLVGSRKPAATPLVPFVVFS